MSVYANKQNDGGGEGLTRPDLAMVAGDLGTVTGADVLREITTLLADRLPSVDPSDPCYPHLRRFAAASGALAIAAPLAAVPGSGNGG